MMIGSLEKRPSLASFVGRFQHYGLPSQPYPLSFKNSENTGNEQEETAETCEKTKGVPNGTKPLAKRNGGKQRKQRGCLK